MSSQTMADEELAFERLLLGAGRAEGLRHEQTEAVLLRFAAGVASLQVAGIGSAGSAGSSAGASAGSWSRFVATAKWLVLGFVAGGAASWAWQHRAPVSENQTPIAARGADEMAQAAPSAAPGVPRAELVPPSNPPPTAPDETTRVTRAANGSAPASPRVKAGADLAAEVTALDGMRTALSIGAWRAADLQLARYRQAFPQGALRSEADVLAIELLVAQGQKQAAVSAAQRFIGKHPRDPQVARVRALVE